MSLKDDIDAGRPQQSIKGRLGKIADLLEKSGIPLEEVGQVQRVNLWQGFYKDPDGEAHTVDMAGLQLVPTWADGPAWPVVQQAKPCVVRHRPAKATVATGRVTLVLPDTQIAYRRNLDTGEMDPVHDVAAIETALNIGRLIRPDRIVLLGDTFDFAVWSQKFLAEPEFAYTTQQSLNYGHRLLAECRAIVGEAGEVVLLEGNHDDRMAIAVASNAKEALRLKRANDPESWPVMTLPHLLWLDDLRVEYVGGYPAGKVKLAEGYGRQTPLFARHGAGAGNVQKDAKAFRQSFVQGHGHHLSVHAETHEYDGDPFDVEVWSLGCLCRLDGAVPSTKGGVDGKGRPVAQHESWQHAVGIVTEHDGGGWDVQPVRIRDGRAVVNGKQVVASAPTPEAA